MGKLFLQLRARESQEVREGLNRLRIAVELGPRGPEVRDRRRAHQTQEGQRCCGYRGRGLTDISAHDAQSEVLLLRVEAYRELSAHDVHRQTTAGQGQEAIPSCGGLADVMVQQVLENLHRSFGQHCLQPEPDV